MNKTEYYKMVNDLKFFLRILKSAHEKGENLSVWSTDVELIEKVISTLSETGDELYTPDQKRVSDYIQEVTNGMIGSGDDPIGFLISSHAYHLEELKELREKVKVNAD